MYARVARFEGGDADAMRKEIEQINGSGDEGPPEGVPAKAFKMLSDLDSGTTLGIVFFETEEDMRKGGEVLDGMSPGIPEAGKRTSVETFEVTVDFSA